MGVFLFQVSPNEGVPSVTVRHLNGVGHGFGILKVAVVRNGIEFG